MGPRLLPYTSMCPGEASPNESMQQITQTSELSVGKSEKPIVPLVQACSSDPDSAKPHTKAVSFNQKHPLNRFNLIWEFALFLYHAKMMRDLNPLQKQKQLL